LNGSLEEMQKIMPQVVKNAIFPKPASLYKSSDIYGLAHFVHFLEKRMEKPTLFTSIAQIVDQKLLNEYVRFKTVS
jgi:hypothetical protein